MSRQYQIEVLLRPPVEWISGVVTLAGVIMIALAPEALLMPPTIALGCIVVLLPLSLRDFWRGAQIMRYRRQLSRTPSLSINTRDIPAFEDKLYIGEGFEWQQKHTQRHADTVDQRYADFIHLDEYPRVREWEKKLARLPVLSWLTHFTASQGILNPWPPKSALGGSSVLHGVEVDKAPVFIPRRVRFMHTYIAGASGNGKTELMELLISQDIRRASHDVVIAFDPKGSHTLLATMYSEAVRANRQDDFVVLHLGFPQISAMYNAAGNYTRITEVASRLSAKVPGEGDSAAFRAFGWRYLNLLVRVCDDLELPVTMIEIRRHIGDFGHLYRAYCAHHLNRLYGEQWHTDYEAMKTQRVDEKRLPGFLLTRTADERAMYALMQSDQYALNTQLYRELLEVFKMSQDFYSRITASIRPVIDKLTSGQLAQILSPSEEEIQRGQRALLDWEQAIRRRSIVYIGLDAMADQEIAQIVGSGIIGDFVSTCSRIYKEGVLGDNIGGAPDQPYDVWVHMDEADALLGDEFIPTINKVRGAGVGLTVYSQLAQDFETGLGSLAKAKQALGNFANIILFRTGNEETGKLITDKTDKVNVSRLVNVTGAIDSADMFDGSVFTSRNEDRILTEMVPMLSASMLMKLPIGEAFAALDGAQVIKLKVPLRVRSAVEKNLPRGVQHMCEYMQKHHRPGSFAWG